MTEIFVDDSIHDRGEFIICGIVISKNNPNQEIADCLSNHGYNPKKDEFKRGLNYTRNPKMLQVRNCLKGILSSCSIGLIVLPSEKRKYIGEETLKGIKQIIDSNKIKGKIRLSIDENFFKSKQSGGKFANDLGLTNVELNLESDSKIERGIQLADLVAHTCSSMLLESMGLINKMVRVGENSGYDLDDEVNLGFELWASVRYQILGEVGQEQFFKEGMPMKKTYPYGLYVSDYCNSKLKEHSYGRFSDIYLGCIH
jgi:hypothetical protein